MRYTILLTAFIFLLIGFVLPIFVGVANAAPLVPCGYNGIECTTCHLLQLGENIIEFIVQISFVIAALLFAYAGFLFFIGGGDSGKITNAKKIFTNTFIGIIIILSSWLVVNIILSTLTGQGVNPFTSILCK